MKKFTSLLIGCSLAFAGIALAQTPEEQASPNKKKGAANKAQAAEAKPGANAAKPQGAAGKQGASDAAKPQGVAGKQQGPADAAKPQGVAGKQQGAANPPAAAKAHESAVSPKPAASTAAGAGASTQPAASPSAAAKDKSKGMKADPKASPSASPAASASPSASVAPSVAPSATPATAASAVPSAATTGTAASTATAPSAAPAAQPNAQGQAAGGKKKPDPQQVQQIKQKNVNFRAQARPQQIPAVTFQQNYRIQGSDRWQGAQYEVYRSYRPERHDEGWYRSRYQRVELIGGGYYYWNNGYWYPAWGFNPQAEYYAYDAPIYVGQRAEPPDKVIADVQSVLQQMGLYKGEVDGLLGPLTREALVEYQSQQGLVATAVIDQPTLDTLGI